MTAIGDARRPPGTAGRAPAGEVVMGSTVQQISLIGVSCGTYWTGTGVAALPGPRGFGPYFDAMNRGYATALNRMTREVMAIGADGVVGVMLTAEPLDGVAEVAAPWRRGASRRVRASRCSPPRCPVRTSPSS